MFNEFRQKLDNGKIQAGGGQHFPESVVIPGLDNTWHDTAEAVVGNWIGLVYQVTHLDNPRIWRGLLLCKIFRQNFYIAPADGLAHKGFIIY